MERVIRFNEGRIENLLAIKYQNMSQSAFRFFRGSCHLFYEDLSQSALVMDAPLAWVCGDLHLENFGSYRAFNGLTYFDLNDFDEAVLAPVFYDPLRLMVSIIVAAEDLQIGHQEAVSLATLFLKQYIDTLHTGRAYMLEREIAEGLIGDFLHKVGQRKQQDFVMKRVHEEKGSLKLIVNKGKALPVADELKQKLSEALMSDLMPRSGKEEDNKQFKVCDIAYRIAGTGSMGLERYVVLADYGNQKLRLIDVKIAQPSCLLPYLKHRQPVWVSEAERIIGVQNLMQFVSPMLQTFSFEGKDFVVRDLQPSQDKFDYLLCEGNITIMAGIVKTLAQLTAWAQLRSSGRRGASSADALIGFHWPVKQLIDYAEQYAAKVQADYQTFVNYTK
jgi:uncharacterized protein (DUF2252 family)